MDKKIVLFHPYVTDNMRERVQETLKTRWIGQGPSVDEFERKFSEKFCKNLNVASVGAGTDALHLAYLLAGIAPGDEVICPVFTCTATNIPLLYIGAKPVFADVQPGTLNIDTTHVESLVTEKTRAIVCVHYGGLPCDMDALQATADKHGIPVIEDAAHAIGATYRGKPIGSVSDFTMFSFQAIKSITTGDGGMVSFKNGWLLPKAKRLRWFGIDREAKQASHWNNDITEVGYKYQMNDIAASMGIAALEEWDETWKHRRALFDAYKTGFKNFTDVNFIGKDESDRTHAAWLCTITAENRSGLHRKLAENGIESSQVHYRNDRYSIFRDSRGRFPNMDAVDDKYLVLPLHMLMSTEDVERIVSVVKEGW